MKTVMKKQAQTALPLAVLSILLAAGQMSARPTSEYSTQEEAQRAAAKSIQKTIGYPAEHLQIMGPQVVKLDVTLQKEGKVVIHRLQSDNPFLAQEIRSRLRAFRKARPEDLRLRLKLQFP
jgi:hypothetical protein